MENTRNSKDKKKKMNSTKKKKEGKMKEKRGKERERRGGKRSTLRPENNSNKNNKAIIHLEGKFVVGRRRLSL